MSSQHIIILLMVRNEGRIIERCMRAAAAAVAKPAAFVLADTGSTDDTVARATATAASLSIPIHVVQYTWLNFGHNRTLSYQAAQAYAAEAGFDPKTTYALALDGDMVLSGELPPAPLTAPGYQLIQCAGSLEYANTRLLRLDVPWTCVGATHEYWDGPTIGPLQPATLWIDDRNDGGCKADKFERDERLLLADLTTDPSNCRTHFYLAQTYKCLGRLNDAIVWYKKRIGLGGWFEEIWYSMYSLVDLYLKLNQPEKAEVWAARAHTLTPYRAEHYYVLCRYYREKAIHWKAAHYYHVGKGIKRPPVALFLEAPVYEHLFDYENTVISYYVNPRRIDGLLASVEYLNRSAAPHTASVWSNLEFYVEQPADTRIEPLAYPPVGDFSPSSCAYTDPSAMNVRYVNYYISADGAYVARDPTGIVRTRNYNMAAAAFLPDSAGLSAVTGATVLGLEDVRLFRLADGSTMFTATTCEYTPVPRVLMGAYDQTQPSYKDVKLLEPPVPTACEKNWAPIDGAAEPTFIYKWHPLQVGTVEDDGRLAIKVTHNTPVFFDHMRGSTPLYAGLAGELWAIVHLVKYSSPRKYFHALVFLDATTYKVNRYSLPFVFEKRQIEYCLAAHIVDDQLHAVFSRNDAAPAWAHVPLKSLVMIGCV